MKLEKIIIKKYKSILNPIEIKFNHNELVLIGKNGSGKTNLLKAIQLALKNKSQSPNIDFEIYLRLTEDEQNKYFDCIKPSDEDKIFKVICNKATNYQIKIQSTLVQSSLSQLKKEIEQLYEDLKVSTNSYLSNLKAIEENETNMFILPEFKIKNENGSITNITKNTFDYIGNNIKNKLDNLKKFKEQFNTDAFSIDSLNLSYNFDMYSIRNYKIDINASISPIVAKSLGLNPNQLEEANNKLKNFIDQFNKQNEESYKEINNIIEKTNKFINQIQSIYYNNYDAQITYQKEKESRQKSFFEIVKKEVFPTCYYLDNENTILFKPLDYQMTSTNESAYDLNSYNPIQDVLKSFINYDDDNIKRDFFASPSKIDSNLQKKFVDMINSRLNDKCFPLFDKNEINGYVLKIENNSPVLYVIEKNNNLTNVNLTSHGRRWYLTYYMIKSILKKGDYFLIDEPAAFLHPEAQIEVKHELENLEKEGIKVIIATHSPYMIPNDWSKVINVKMDERGTMIQRFNGNNELYENIISELGNLNANNILFSLSKTLLLVEGEADKAVIKKLSDLLGYDISDYSIHVCDGDSIMQVSYICITNNIKFIAIADSDNKSKEEWYLNSHKNFKKCLNKYEQDYKHCFFVGNDSDGLIEDLFDSKDNVFRENKKGKDKIDIDLIQQLSSKDSLSDKAIQNFNDLFSKIGLHKNNIVKKS